MKTVATKTLYTAEEFFRLDLPEHEKWELVGGELEWAPAPNYSHQKIAQVLIVELELWLRAHPMADPIQDWDVEFLLDETRWPDLVIALKKGSRLKVGVHGMARRILSSRSSRPARKTGTWATRRISTSVAA